MNFPITVFLCLFVGAAISCVLSRLLFGNWKVGFTLLSVWLRTVDVPEHEDPPTHPSAGAQIVFVVLVILVVVLTYTSASHFLGA